MHLTDHDRMEAILSYRRTQPPRSSLLSQATEETYSLIPMARVQPGDIVEDIQTGTREVVRYGNFYDFLVGVPVRQVRQLPSVFDVRRTRG